MLKPLCLLIDDEPDILDLLVMTLEPMGIACCCAKNFTEAQKYLTLYRFNLCLTDMRLPDGNGLDIIDIIVQKYPFTPIAMITAHGDMETAIKAMKAGAFDFISKPFKDLKELRNLVSSALKLPENSVRYKVDLIGKSTVMQNVRNKIEKLARTQTPVYITGESGTGKEIVARMIHNNGVRTKKPFVAINCGAIPQELMESEFFGHKKGSFTGANIDKLGLFQTASGGTLFLDEVADLPLSMQVKLLRAIQEKTVRPVGATKEIPVNVRILSATNYDLAQLVKLGKFRQDLFYRINVIELYIPPLRKRTEDIPDLVEYFLKKFAANQKIYVLPETMRVLTKYFFSGNVRELENILERAITLCENNEITIDDLQLPKDKIIQSTNLNEDEFLDPLLNEIERETIFNTLKQANNNKTKAAQILGMKIGAFRYRLGKYKK
ncbi:MAG: sigma-54 dependent transcriptional regulator [Candidatus Marithrix sp.]